MCAKSPKPVAPPAPIPERDSNIDATRNRQTAAASASQSGYNSTLVNDSSVAANVASPTLGGGSN